VYARQWVSAQRVSGTGTSITMTGEVFKQASDNVAVVECSGARIVKMSEYHKVSELGQMLSSLSRSAHSTGVPKKCCVSCQWAHASTHQA
jgi:hypothetical protein